MAGDNGTGSVGGNGSVYWEINGPRVGGLKPVLANTIPVAPVPGSKYVEAGPGRNVDVTDAVALGDVVRHVRRGEIKVKNSGVEGHTDTDFDRIGRSTPPSPDDHPGMFRVRLRFRDADLEKMPAAERDWILERAKRVPELDTASWFLFIDVPAIPRNQPPDGTPWPNLPFEIHWEW